MERPEFIDWARRSLKKPQFKVAGRLQRGRPRRRSARCCTGTDASQPGALERAAVTLFAVRAKSHGLESAPLEASPIRFKTSLSFAGSLWCSQLVPR
jgi:hypothetical protein